MRQIIIALAFTVISFFPAGSAFAISDLTTVCSGGTYDYCSQAPKCGEYPEWNNIQSNTKYKTDNSA